MDPLCIALIFVKTGYITRRWSWRPKHVSVLMNKGRSISCCGRRYFIVILVCIRDDEIHRSTSLFKRGHILPPRSALCPLFFLNSLTLTMWSSRVVGSICTRFYWPNNPFCFSESNDWCGIWGKHIKSLCFKTLKEFQKINHFPGTFQIGRKDRLWKNLYRLMTKFGKKEYV
jgi:hypothetical protein